MVLKLYNYMKLKTYWIDADIDDKPTVGNWQAKNKEDAKRQVIAYYISKGIGEREIIIRTIK